MLWVKLFNIIALLALIAWFARRKLNQYFENKQKDLNAQMASAAEDLRAIQEDYDSVSEKMKSLSQEMESIRVQAQKEWEEEAKRIETDTEQFIKKLFRDNNARMEQSIEKARRDFRNELVESSLGSSRDELIGRKAEQDSKWILEVIEKSEEQEGQKEYAS